MKNTLFLLTVCLLIVSCGPTTVIQSGSYEPAPAPPAEDLSYQSFYDQLSPYGSWINYPGYGYVWMPNAGADFRPYSTNGNWIYTDAGWTWASNYSWGWAPFHYGRWFYEGGYGWMWMPGNEWAPAWVSWRGSGDYYGWAPMEPRVTVDVALSSYNPPSNYWNFVPRQYIGNPGWHNYNVDVSRNVTIISNTTVINNYSGTNRNKYAYAPGPDPNEVRRVSGNNFAQVQLRAANSPGERVSGSQYTVYQPRVNATVAARSDAAGRPSAPAPAHYETFNNLRHSNPPVNQSANTQPAYNNHPATQNPVYNQPNNNRPVLQTPESAQPSGQNHQNNQSVNNNPANAGRPSTQVPANNQSVQANATGSTRPNNNQPGQPQTNMHQPHNNMASQTSNANHTQTTGRPSDNHNPNSGRPQQKPVTNPKPAPKKVAPEQKATENPKTKEAGNN